MGLDQDHFGTHLCRPGGDRKPTRSGADNAEIGGDVFSHDRFPLPRLQRPRSLRRITGSAASVASPNNGSSIWG